ncbi:beta-lactamase class A [Cytobacillus firmus]|uniref:Beta-lactamase class A n=2 Tax=Cytobacillus TaxID=2675230 RepID=A0A366JKJ7_CYTFI|nr:MULTISPECIES: serine hydrolase [Cytobacillus]RBP88025.1 beta-lactamase class A [Cytobacillus firmus]TDX37757.1 beta-lactamase class A [Cytobacillus oceanisediminis]
MNFHTLKAEILDLASCCEGHVAVYIHTGDGVIETNADDVISSASLIKVPILLAGLSQAENNLLQLDEEAEVNDTVRVGGAGVLQAMSKDLKVKVIDLMTLMVIVSDNTATNLIIERLGIEKINQLIKGLGFNCTELNRKMMDFEALKNGMDNITTARDMVYGMKALAEHSLLSGKYTEKALDILEKQQYKNKLANTIDTEKVKVASKTGELPGIEHDCAIFTYKGNTVYAAVLVDQLQSQAAGGEVLAAIGSRINQYITHK